MLTAVSIRSLCLGLALLGCDPSLSQLPDGTGASDGSAPDVRIVDATPGDAPCLNPVPLGELESGHHYPGERCTLGCHDGANGPKFHFGGTLYANYGGQAPRPGAYISILDNQRRQYNVVAQANGNFWMPETLGPVEFPVKTWASACPTVSEMLILTPAPGDCNDPGGACHTHDPPFRVRLPLN